MKTMNRMFLTAVVTLALALASPAAAQSASDLLQKGIYTQESLGNLDAAITIYKQILGDVAASRVYASQAQFRLGLCYIQKGQQADAAEAFQKLIKDYPEQTELVAKAKEYVPGGLKLLPVPWEDGEALQLVLKTDGGAEIGAFIWTAEAAQDGERQTWLLDTFRYVPTMQALSRVTVDRETFRPIRSADAVPGMNAVLAEYGPGEVKLERAGKDAQTVNVVGAVYDNDQVIHLIRRLPLAEGYKVTIPVFTALGGSTIEIPMEVTQRKTIEAPAGKYECYGLHMGAPINQMYWFSTDPRHYLVKFEASPVIGELTAIRQKNGPTPNEYRDDEFGFTLVAPAGWFFQRLRAGLPDNQRNVHVIDPDAAATTMLWAGKLDPGKLAYEGDLRRGAEEKIAERKKQFKDYTVRPDSWTPRTVNGRPALGYTADCTLMNKQITEFMVFVGGTSSSFQLSAKVERAKAGEFRQKFDDIVNRFVAK
jgi:hypothetical protein